MLCKDTKNPTPSADVGQLLRRIRKWSLHQITGSVLVIIYENKNWLTSKTLCMSVDCDIEKNNKNTTHDGCGLRPNVLFFRPCA